MDYESLAVGMTGQQFIDAFNGNFTKTDVQFNNVAAAIILRVIANNVKALKSVDNKLLFTLDGENWLNVNDNAWGSITGSITDQADLIQLLNGKATNEQVQSLNTSIENVSNKVSGLETTIPSISTSVQENKRDIGALQSSMADKVSSETIIGFRISSSNFLQYTTDGVSWVNVQSVANINWGAIGGEISNQQDLAQMFNSKVNVSALNQHLSDTDNPHSVTAAQVGLGNVDNTSDADKPISTAQQEKFDEVDETLDNLDNNKMNVDEDIKAIQYITLAEWNEMLDAGTLSETTLYIVD